jgi:hypothetical protein
MSGQNQGVYKEQGANNIVVGSGGAITVRSGGVIDIQAGAKASPVAGATFTIGTESANAINVAIQLTDATGADLAVSAVVGVFLSDNASGLDLTATGPATSVAIGTDGAFLVTHVAKKIFTVQSESDGDIDITLTETGVATWYMVVVLPNGLQVVSNAITFA